MRRDERLLVPDAKSPFSTSATESPRIAASRAMDAPAMPPPLTARSKGSLCSGLTKGTRSAAGGVERQVAVPGERRLERVDHGATVKQEAPQRRGLVAAAPPAPPRPSA